MPDLPGRIATPEPEWTCPQQGCDLDADGHDLALAMEHIYDIEPEAAQGAADRTIQRMEGLL